MRVLRWCDRVFRSQCKLSHLYELVRFQTIRIGFDHGLCGYLRFDLRFLYSWCVLWIRMLSSTSSLLLCHHECVDITLCNVCLGFGEWIVGKDSCSSHRGYRDLWIGSIVSLVCNHALYRGIQVLSSYDFDVGNVRLCLFGITCDDSRPIHTHTHTHRYGLGFVFYITRFPESKFPNRFDLFGSSHQFWHVAVLTAAIMWQGTLVNFANMEHVCPAVELEQGKSLL